MRILFIGFGTVGQGLVEILAEKADRLQQQYHFKPRIVGVATRSFGALTNAEGLSMTELLSAAQAGGLQQYTQPAESTTGDLINWIGATDADVLVEVTPSDLETAEPAINYCRAALRSGKHVVLANKGPVALAYNNLQQVAIDNQRQLRLEATVMAGTPAIRTGVEALAGCTITRVRGILNGTTNYMLGKMEEGVAYDEVLREAQALGYAETDPTADVGGWDAAGKVLILQGALFGTQSKMQDLQVEGITDITAEMIQQAQDANERYKLIATATPHGGSVKPLRLPLSDPLASVADTTNALTYTTDLLGDVTIIGRGAGKRETGAALLADLLALS